MSVKKITVNGRTYAADVLPPLEAIDWVPRILSCGLAEMGEGKISNPAEVSSLTRDALKRCWTPDNRKLDDAAVFTEWFAKHPSDLIQLGLQAAVEVCRDFLSSPDDTPAKNSLPSPGGAR